MGNQAVRRPNASDGRNLPKKATVEKLKIRAATPPQYKTTPLAPLQN